MNELRFKKVTEKILLGCSRNIKCEEVMKQELWNAFLFFEDMVCNQIIVSVWFTSDVKIIITLLPMEK